MKNNIRGITLIALIITIIVLLILAGVSIVMLTGQNGLLTQAQNAKTATEKSAEQEKVQIAVTGSRNDEGQLSIEKLKSEIESQNGKVLGDSIPTTVEIDSNLYRVNSSGEVTKRIEGGTLGRVTGTETTNTTVQDALGNQVVVPAGFKIVNTNDYVTDGIIIEDVSYEATKGSQFVWIPVGNIKKQDNTIENIKLSRYAFFTNESVYDCGAGIIGEFQELNTSNYGNITAKENIESEDSGFRKSAIENNGYYIGRYEARDKDATEARTSASSKTNQAVITANNYVYNYVTQKQAAELSRNMYANSRFESDLCNSYAWDSAIVFLQKFDNTILKNQRKYAVQKTLNTEKFDVTGTNNETDLKKIDVICNIYDMASNCLEWSTETRLEAKYCTRRGGNIHYDYTFAGFRGYNGENSIFEGDGFRPILYLK